MMVGGDGNGVDYARRHIRFGWWCLLFFLTFGMVLEILHGFKVGWYLNVTNETRRLVLSQAHSHGTLFALINVAFAATLRMYRCSGGWVRIASACLIGATLLLPGGFFLGGLVIYGGDPGLGILLVPVGAALLFVGVLLTAMRGRPPEARIEERQSDEERGD